jgi:[ribosomal protein S5]-alanine N-acetyltransferase
MLALDHPLFTPRLRLEPVTARLAAAAREGERAFASVLNAQVPDDWRAASLDLIGRSARSSWGESDPPIRAVVVHREDGCVIGDVRFEPSPQTQDEIEIGYSVAASRRRQGFAVEASGAVIDWLFQEGGGAEIIAGCDRRNLASVRTLRRLGFWLDGARRGAFWWVLTPELRRETRLHG